MSTNGRPTPPPPQKCVTPNCQRQAFSNWPYCGDCNDEVKHWAPDVWAARVAEYQRNKGEL